MWIRKLPLIPTIITLLCVVIMFGLGIWQLERKAEKDSRLDQMQERESSRPYNLSELNELYYSGLEYDTNIQDFPVEFNGIASLDTLFFIDNKIHEGQIGYQVVLPIQIIDGDYILANLGWLRGNGIRGELPNLPKKEQTELSNKNVAFRGVVHYPSNNTMVTETNSQYGSFPALLQQIDLEKMERHLKSSLLNSNSKLYPFIVNIAPDQNSELVRNWQSVVMSPEKHLGYAAQWFGLGIAALTIFLLSLLKQLQTKNNKEN